MGAYVVNRWFDGRELQSAIVRKKTGDTFAMRAQRVASQIGRVRPGGAGEERFFATRHNREWTIWEIPLDIYSSGAVRIGKRAPREVRRGLTTAQAEMWLMAKGGAHA